VKQTPNAPPSTVQTEDRTKQQTEQEPVIEATGDLSVAEGAVLHAPLRVQGRLIIGRLAHMVGSVTSLTGAEVCDGAIIDGQLTVTGPVRWGDHASVSAAAIGGALITSGELVRATSVIATAGIHDASPPAGRPKEATA